MTKTESAVQWAIGIANDNRHGYSQANRWGNPDYDCSSLVISAWQQAGVPVKSNGATYTGNMYNVFRACGFTDVTSSCNRATGAGMQRGDVLLNVKYHTAMYIGGGQMVQASSTRGHPEAGEQRYGCADIIIIREDGIMYYVILPVEIQVAVEDRNQYNRHPEFRLYSGFLDRKENIYGNSNA